jgi:hypothetical protein
VTHSLTACRSTRSSAGHALRASPGVWSAGVRGRRHSPDARCLRPRSSPVVARTETPAHCTCHIALDRAKCADIIELYFASKRLENLNWDPHGRRSQVSFAPRYNVTRKRQLNMCSGIVGVRRATTSRAGRTGLSFGWRFAYWTILGSIFLFSPTPLYHSQDLFVHAGSGLAHASDTSCRAGWSSPSSPACPRALAGSVC